MIDEGGRGLGAAWGDDGREGRRIKGVILNCLKGMDGGRAGEGQSVKAKIR